MKRLTSEGGCNGSNGSWQATCIARELPWWRGVMALLGAAGLLRSPREAPPLPPLVLSGHAASLTPY